MVIYEVTMDVDRAFADAVETYMRKEHIADVLATGCFDSAAISRSGTRLQIRYCAKTASDVDRYFAEHTERMRADVAARFPTGINASREIWTELETITPS